MELVERIGKRCNRSKQCGCSTLLMMIDVLLGSSSFKQRHTQCRGVCRGDVVLIQCLL